MDISYLEIVTPYKDDNHESHRIILASAIIKLIFTLQIIKILNELSDWWCGRIQLLNNSHEQVVVDHWNIP